MAVLVLTIGKGALDFYGLKLSERLDTTSVHIGLREPFEIPVFSLETLRLFMKDYKIIKMLNRQRIIHLAHHHLARYINFLKKPCILTVHDLIRQLDRLGYPTLIHKPNLRDKIYLWLDWQGMRKARHIIAISQNTKRDLIDCLKIPEERVTVIYNGIDHDIFKPSPEPRLIDDPYILYVGSEQPRKNLPLLLQAFRILKADKRFASLKLIKVGEPGGREANFRQQTLEVIENLKLDEDMIFTGFVSEKELVGLYSNAQCFVFPSLYEGFGFPVVEAMACGCPVITSNTSSLPEIVGEAGIMVKPHDARKLAKAMKEVLTNHELREDLRRKGLEQAGNFSWEKTAEETMKVYQRLEEEV